MTTKNEFNHKHSTKDEQFRKMAVLANEIREKRPWEHAGCPGPFVCHRDESSPAYIYTLTNDDGYGITVFFTSRDYNRSGIECDDPKAELRKDIELAFFCVAFSDWEELQEGERETFERLSLQFPEGCWPHFVSKRRGFMPASLTPDEFERMAECLWHFSAQLDAMRENGDLFRFKRGEMARRYYDAETQEWKHALFRGEVVAGEWRVPLWNMDEPEFQRLKQIPFSADVPELEVDFGWLCPQGTDCFVDGYEFGMLVAVTNRKTKEVLLRYGCAQEDFDMCMADAVSEVIEKCGKPRKIYICRVESSSILWSFAREVNIELECVESLQSATAAVYSCGAV